jgi:hypothetical protein
MIPVALLLAVLGQDRELASIQTIHKATPDAPIAFVHVKSESPGLGLDIYSDSRRIASWPPDPDQVQGPALTAGERFLLHPSWRLLGVGSYLYDCKFGSTVAGLGKFSKLRFLPNFPRTSLPDPPQPPIPPLPQVAGACSVRFSSDGTLVVFATTDLEPSRPSRFTIFRREPQFAGEFAQVANFLNRTQGEVWISADGGVLARRDGDEIVVFKPGPAAQEGSTRRPALRAMALSSGGDHLARWSSSQIVFTPLADGSAHGSEIVFPTSTPCLDVRFAGNLALIRERSRVQLLELPTAQVLWSRSTTEGHYASIDLIRPGASRTLVALGRRITLRAPARRGSGLVEGLAQALTEVVDAQDDQVLAESQDMLASWDYDTPAVRFVGNPVRLIVTTPQSALLSEVIP